jgi:hypothetical protein
MMAAPMGSTGGAIEGDPTAIPPAPEPAPKKKGRTNTPWTAEEEQRLKTMRDAGRSWSEIAKVRLFEYGLELTVPQAFFLTCRRLSLRGLRAV